MFQSFSESAHPEQGPPRLAALREVMADARLDGFIVPRADAYQGEYVAPCDERLAWLTGFTGSAGFCIALRDKAGVFVDGRYRTQVRSQVDLAHFTPVNWPETAPADWLAQELPEGGLVGYDPWLHTPREIETLTNGLRDSGVTLKATDNLVDRIWPDRPAPPMGPIRAYPAELAGLTHAQKRATLAAELSAGGHDAAVLTLPDSIAWLLNIRGSDIPRNPVPHAFAILHATAKVTLFVEAEKLDGTLRAHLGDDVIVRPPSAFGPALHSLTGPVRLDARSVPVWVMRELDQAGVPRVWGDDPCVLPKACKTDAEIAATREAHLRDGAALCEFLAWYDEQAPGSISEIDVVRRLEECRRATGALLDISFDTIAGSGPNGALAHYRVSTASNRILARGDLLVLDGGGQYLDGTTDITRTLPVGEAADIGADERAAFTRVLQGMIAMSRVRWPAGLAGRDLDVIARYPLWLADQDYAHGTGHGVGVNLCVHEGPQRLARISEVPLRAGMILSNEPGYYREVAFGIRIENLLVVQEAETLPGGDATGKLCFETLSFVPIDRRLIDASRLSDDERDWLDGYHALCRDLVGPRVAPAVRAWLDQATAPLGDAGK
ncbi:aminopeptidase P family protein [Roseovarius sp. SCSIO 43702]|uniref:aminopeptidase P family protein n=1 Tax=Roseovarius sp. SCSIO 43702 TaxID=2823043 RepID=UPI001C72A779|nr:aminopeptidase P family protein [Roseovarius sp. SCSIO 43702]QYX55856.1 aminopeptidase P family protein [Roseovarius sp. SCSIO 43702]